MITNHTELLNALIEKYGLKSYLEIGVQNPANNFDKINTKWKTGTDPETPFRETGTSQIFQLSSDTFFTCNSEIKYDLIFIDGLHHADQVKRDFENSLRCLSSNGFIVIHDVLPENEAGTAVPRATKVWWGDVYKWAMIVHSHYENIDFKTFNIDNGCMIVWKDKTKKAGVHRFMMSDKSEWWPTYTAIGKNLMNVTDEVVI